MNSLKRKSGVTLIELIITLGLIGVIVALVFFFFGTNQRTLNTVGVKSDLQYEAKKVVESFSKYAMEAISAKVELDASGDFQNIAFDLASDYGSRIPSGAVFSKEGSTFKVVFAGQVDEIILSEYVDTFKAEVDQVKDSVYIEFKVVNKGISYSVKENYLFRNSHIK